MAICRICGADSEDKYWTAHEMMFGTRDSFMYFECSQCGCIQISEAPKNLAKYYPRDYYAFSNPSRVITPKLKGYLKSKRLQAYLGSRTPIGIAMLMLFKPAYPVWLEHLKIKRDSKLLDVGCGDGAFLYWLHDHGYSALWGVDAFLSPDFSGAPDLRIEKGTISDITEHDFDFVTLHHSLEHMIDHDTVLTDIYRVLRSGGCALIRTPINSYAWKEYGVNWVQLDAPRHLLIHSEKSMKMLAYRNGFKVSRVVYDSNEFMYWGSEQYLRDMPLSHPRSHSIDPANSLFSRSDMTRFRDEASRMNAIGCGDQACFFLTKP